MSAAGIIAAANRARAAAACAAASKSASQAAFLAFLGRRDGFAVPGANRPWPPVGRPGRRVLPE